MYDFMREAEACSLRNFVVNSSNYFVGKVLDFGSGREPYRQIVQDTGATYHPFDRIKFPASRALDDSGVGLFNTHWDTILCTQVMQYIADPQRLIHQFLYMLNEGGHLVMTYPTHWPEVEKEDLWRFTKAGMDKLLHNTGFEVLYHDRTHPGILYDHDVAMGYGVVARG